MKKLWIALLVSAMFVVSATPALAAGGPPPGRARGNGFVLAGIITALDDAAVTVQVAGGNPAVHETSGQTLVIQTTSSTRYLLKTDTGTEPVTAAYLAVGQKISASGTVADNVWTATRITVGAAVEQQQDCPQCLGGAARSGGSDARVCEAGRLGRNR